MTYRNAPKSWSHRKLSDLVFFQRGFDITQAEQKPGDIPVISSSGISSYHAAFKAEGPGVVIGRKGTLGKVHFVDENYWPHDTTLWSKDFKGNNPRFVYYFLQTLDFKRFDVGSSNPTLNRNHIHDLDVEIPPLPEQIRISEYLCAYDDLIENNHRRMALLEESARLLYQEWFIHLRFPGHGHVRITDGVPEGWERVALEEALVLQRGFDLPTQDRREGSVPIYGSTGIVDHHDEAKTRGPGVVTGRSGTLGQVHYVMEDFWPLNTALWVKEFKRVSPLFALFLLKALDLRQFNGGASVPTLDHKAVHRVTILLPLRQLITDFTDLASDIFEQINNLNLQNQKLRTARDLLLPRLMSSEITI